ncbi:MAG: GyrI-like domain-containing protein [Thermodesulfobacteriota bacterium]
MDKIDLKKSLKHLYQASPKEVALVEVPRLQYLQVEGRGDPNTVPAFPQAAEALFRISYTLKFMVKKEGGPDYAVMPLEGLWSAEDLAAFSQDRRGEWQWTLMILQPEFITREAVARAVAQVRKNNGSPLLEALKLAPFSEGQSAQILHVGPYGGEAPTIERLHRFIRDKGYHFGGKHHEIYLNDPRRTAPARLKTIIRQPITLEAMK